MMMGISKNLCVFNHTFLLKLRKFVAHKIYVFYSTSVISILERCSCDCECLFGFQWLWNYRAKFGPPSQVNIAPYTYETELNTRLIADSKIDTIQYAEWIAYDCPS